MRVALRRTAGRLSRPVLLLALSLVAGGLHAQVPILPDADAIVAYIHVSNPRNLDSQLDGLLRAVLPARDDAAPFQPRVLLGRWLGDPDLRLVPELQPVTLLWIRTGSGAVRHLIVVPLASDPAYLSACAARNRRSAASAQSISLMGSPEALASAESLLPSIARLHEAVHPAEVSCLFLSGLWSGTTEQTTAFLSHPHLRPLTPLLALPEERGPAILQGPPTPVPEQTPPTPVARSLARILGDVQMLHVAFDTTRPPQRIRINLEARPGSPLAALLNQPAAPVNAYCRYLSRDARLRTAFSLNTAALPALLDGSTSVTAETSPAVRLACLQGPGALALDADAWQSLRVRLRSAVADYLGRAVRNSAYSADQTRELLGRINAALPALPAAAPGAIETILTTRNGKDDLPRLEPLLFAASGASVPPLELLHRNAVIEGFPIDQYFEKSASAAPTPVLKAPPGPPAPGRRPVDQSLLSICKVTDYLAVASRFPDMQGVMRRILRLDALSAPLESEAAFIAGGHVYADLRAGKSGAPATPAKAELIFFARFAGHRLQVVLALP